jgi:hypothetical protein
MDLHNYDYDYSSMNCTEHIHGLASYMKRLMKWPLLCGLLGFTLACPAPAADDTYLNDAVVTYPGTVAFPPVIDATNFVNTGTFIINFTTLSLAQPFYETSDTLNYTNTGLMMVNTGFRFSNQSSGNAGTRTMSSSFVNQSTISCGSVNNTGDPFGGFLGLFGYSQCIVNATNILSPGEIVAGVDGLIQLAGQNVDLSRSYLNIEGSTANAAGTGTFGLNTNFWDPSFELGPTSAASAFIPIAPFFLNLTNSLSYFDVATPNASNIIYRAIFIQDTSGSNVSYNVYFGNTGLDGSGAATIEWAGHYTDPATGNSISNYLYLRNDYLQSTSTNIFLNNGIPDNFTFSSSTTPAVTGITPTAAGFLNVFPIGTVTNRYSYANAQLISTTVGTNSVVNGSVTNLPGRVEITASDELDLSFANISGLNYMSLQSPHQFDGSQGASIQAPYSDINIGVTNGFLTVSNLMAPFIPVWSGNVQAWSTRWVEVVNGVTNDFRVMIVGSQLSPLNPTVQQDVKLHGTNSIIISDTFNILRSFTTDAQNLTLRTNQTGYGATSFDGEINVLTPDIFWASSLPNLRYLTNDGAIRLQNLTQFWGSSNSITVTPAVAATGILAEVSGRTNLLANNKLLIGTNVYVFVSKLTNSFVNQVKIATKFDGTMSNLIAAINRTAGAGNTYSTATTSNTLVAAGLFSTNTHSFMVTARTAGAAGNAISTTASTVTTNVTWNGFNTLQGGADVTTNVVNVPAAPYRNLINRGLISDFGTAARADYFFNSGTITNGTGSFNLQSLNTVLSNGTIVAGGDITISTASLLASNVVFSAGRSIVLAVTNTISDTGVANGNNWFVGGSAGVGFSLSIRPSGGDLLGTTITNQAPTNKIVANIWSARDVGTSTAGFTNNQALGRLILDGLGTFPQGGGFKFSGISASNAIYVDYLELQDAATNQDVAGNLTALSFSTNLVIYYAAAYQYGVPISEKINHKNGDHLRWIPAYTGYFSSTNLVYPPGITNIVNATLIASTSIDSDGDGIVNANDSTPLLVPEQVNFTATVTNRPPLSIKVQWVTIPNATNFIYYRTNLAAGAWLPFTNFSHFYYGSNVAVTNATHSNRFIAPQSYPGSATNVWVFDTVTNVPHYYQVQVAPWLTYPF